MSRVTKYLRYTLALNAPAIVSTLSGDPNSSTTQPFIPGGVIRGVLAGQLLAGGIAAESSEFRRLILDGDVRFLHAYPSEGSVRSFPTPIPWQTSKGEIRSQDDKEPVMHLDRAAYTGVVQPDSFISWENETLKLDPDDIWPTASLRRAEYAFIESSGSKRRGVRIRTDVRIHQQRDRDKGRSWKTTLPDGSEVPQGGLFAYEFLEPDQTFQGLFQVWGDTTDEADALIALIETRLNGRQIFIGRSRRAGYGGAATISFGPIERQELSDGELQHDTSVGSLFRAQLLSSCIVRDSLTGQLDPASFPEQLREQLGGKAVVQVERVLWDFETVGGFNRKWQLEVPQALAVKAGSVLVLRAKRAIPPTTLRQIEHTGLGERRIEGFGRLVFLKNSDSLIVNVEAGTNQPAQAAPSTGDPPELVTFIQRRILDAAFARALDRQVRFIVGDSKKLKLPTGSLIGRLRIPLRTGNPAAGLQTLQQWIAGDDDPKDRTKLKREARDKLRDCRFSNTTLFDWLRDQASPSAGAQFASNITNNPPNQLGGDRQLAAVAAESQGAAYAVRLIDAVLATLARHARRREREVAQ